MAERKLSKLVPLTTEKILHKSLQIENTLPGRYTVRRVTESCKPLLRREQARSLASTADCAVPESALLFR
jgi:hypothetical protein